MDRAVRFMSRLHSVEVCVSKMEYVLFKKPYLIDGNMAQIAVFMLSDMPITHPFYVVIQQERETESIKSCTIV